MAQSECASVTNEILLWNEFNVSLAQPVLFKKWYNFKFFYWQMILTHIPIWFEILGGSSTIAL